MSQVHCNISGNDVSELSEEMELLHIDVFTDEAQNKPGRRDTPCSRNVWRKQRNWERRVAGKKRKRKEEKRKKKLNQEQQKGGAEGHVTKRLQKVMTLERLAEAQNTGLRLCVDLSMTESMSDKEISRLSAQLRRLYGSNRKAPRPFHLFLSDLKENQRLFRECLRMNSGFLTYMVDMSEDSCVDLFPGQTLVYLTPDAEHALETVDTDKVYVLGGLVDESVQKRLSLGRATELKVHTARLPIDEYMVKKHNPKNFHSKILAVNQVLDILLVFYHTGSWTEAFRTCFPQGKGYIVPKDTSSALDNTAAPSVTMDTL